MARIPNWTRTVARNASDVGIYGTVRKWEHDDTGDTVAVKKADPYEGSKRYDIAENGEVHSARDTMTAAIRDTVEWIRNRPDGLD